jgi:ketosteroid isomerase-like protein
MPAMRVLRWGLALLFALGSGAAASPGEQALAALEAWRQATESKDVEALGKLLHPDLTYSHSDGKTQTRADVLAGLPASGKREIVIQDPSVRVYGDTAIVRANVDFINPALSPPAVSRLSVLHVFLRDAGGWRLVARQSTRLNP